MQTKAGYPLLELQKATLFLYAAPTFQQTFRTVKVLWAVGLLDGYLLYVFHSDLFNDLFV